MIDTALDVYRDQFPGFAESAGPALGPLRRRAFDRFLELGFPTTRHEEWRFTNVAPIADTPFRLATPQDSTVTAADLAGCTLDRGWPRLVFVNGRYTPSLSTAGTGPGHVTATSLAEELARDPRSVERHLGGDAAYRDHSFVALNTAFMSDGAFVVVPRNTVVEQPIDLLYVSAGTADPIASHPRTIIIAEPGSQVTIIERYVGLGESVTFTNAVTEIIVGESATVDHYKIGREAETAFHVGTTLIRQSRDSRVSSHAVTIGGGLVRNNITTVLDGEGGHCTLNGLYLMHGRQHVDNHLRVEHASPHCDSREFFKGILNDRSRAVFSGRIVVHKDAQKTDAKQTNMNLLLSEDARVDTKPQLEILADDVKCTHGATIGQIDDDAVFYLCSRGIPPETARAVLVYAFAAESLDQVRPEPLRRRLRETLFDLLPQGQQLREAM